MNTQYEHYDAIIIGSGPAGQNAAITAAKSGARTLIIEREVEVGGACLQYGTIPSKTLRETAVALSSFRHRSGDVYHIEQREDLQIDSLMTRLHNVVLAHQKTTKRYLDATGVERLHGHAEFLAPNQLSVGNNKGEQLQVRGNRIFIATGSRPRNPDEFPIDHEHIFDSDSILSMTYLPQSMVVFGGGVIACEYAATFACLGVDVTIIDRYPSPLGFLDDDLIAGFLTRFEANGGKFLGNRTVASVEWDGVSHVVTTCDDGQVIRCDKAFAALGRVANTDALNLSNAGLTVTDRALIQVNENFETDTPNIYAMGDAIGPPSLASCSMHQGRAAASHAFQLTQPHCDTLTPMGIYTIPEIASIGIDETRAARDQQTVIVGKVHFDDLARGQIMAAGGGLLKLIADESGHDLLGVQIVGDGATELIHLGQMAIASSMSIDQLSTTNFNFPTLAEAYRLAALAVIAERNKQNASSPVTNPRLVIPFPGVVSDPVIHD